MKTPRSLCRFLAALTLMLASHAHAQDVSDAAFNRFRSQVVGNQVQFSYGTGGTPLAGGSSSAGTAVTGGVDVSRGVAVQTKHGPVIGSLTQKISNASMGKAFGRAAAVIGGPLGLAFLALPAIVDWMTDNGVRPAPSGGGFEGLDTSACTVAPCYEYTYSTSLYPWVRSPAQACTTGFAHVQGSSTTTVYTFTAFFAPDICQGTRKIGTAAPTYSAINVIRRSASVEIPGYVPLTALQLESRMSANTSPEALAELYKLAAPLDIAHPIPDLVDTLRADFDARSPESTETTTTETPTQEKTTERTCATYTQLVGSTLSLVEQCETTTTTQPLDPVTGDPVGAPTVETETGSNTTPDPATRPDTEPQAAVCGGPGLPNCNVKVDESGTPTGESFGESADLNAALDGRLDGLATARDMAGDTGWGIIPAWTQDTPCEAWHIFTLPDFLGSFEADVNLCPFMPVADGIANFIWVMLGIFAVTGMVARAMTGGGV